MLFPPQYLVFPCDRNCRLQSLKVKSRTKDLGWPNAVLPVPARQLPRDPLCPPVLSASLFNGHPPCRRAPAEGIGSCVSKLLLVEFSRPPPRLEPAPLARVPCLAARPPLPPSRDFIVVAIHWADYLEMHPGHLLPWCPGSPFPGPGRLWCGEGRSAGVRRGSHAEPRGVGGSS